MWEAVSNLCPRTRRRFFYAARVIDMQGVPHRLSARRELRLRALLRPARGALCVARRRRPRGIPPPHPGGTALDLALPRLPAAGGPAAARHAAGGLDAAAEG